MIHWFSQCFWQDSQWIYKYIYIYLHIDINDLNLYILTTKFRLPGMLSQGCSKWIHSSPSAPPEVLELFEKVSSCMSHLPSVHVFLILTFQHNCLKQFISPPPNLGIIWCIWERKQHSLGTLGAFFIKKCWSSSTSPRRKSLGMLHPCHDQHHWRLTWCPGTRWSYLRRRRGWTYLRSEKNKTKVKPRMQSSHTGTTLYGSFRK